MTKSLLPVVFIFICSIGTFSCQPKCKSCTSVTVAETFEGQNSTGTATTETVQEFCDDLLEMVEENPVTVTESDFGNPGAGFKIVNTVTTTCQ